MYRYHQLYTDNIEFYHIVANGLCLKLQLYLKHLELLLHDIVYTHTGLRSLIRLTDVYAQ